MCILSAAVQKLMQYLVQALEQLSSADAPSVSSHASGIGAIDVKAVLNSMSEDLLR